jgi:hypothetical protein
MPLVSNLLCKPPSTNDFLRISEEAGLLKMVKK